MEQPKGKVFGYVRVSTDHQTVENQKMAIQKFCEQNGLKIDDWIAETVSGAKKIDKRKLGELLKHVEYGDLIVSTEISRLGRSLFMVMEVLNICMDKGVKVWTIKDNYRLGDGIESKVLAFAFGLAAEIERKMISERTKQGLARVRANGVVLGRPKGRKSRTNKLDPHADQIQEWLNERVAEVEISRRLNVSRMTVAKYIKNKPLSKPASYPELFYQRGVEAVQADLLSGKTVTQIAKENNVSFSVVDNFVKTNALTIPEKEVYRNEKIKPTHPLDGKNEQIQKMLEDGMTKKSIAEYLDVTVGVLGYWLRKNEFKIPPKEKLYGMQAHVAQMLVSGKTYGWIARELNVSKPTVSSFVRRHDLNKYKKMSREDLVLAHLKGVKSK